MAVLAISLIGCLSPDGGGASATSPALAPSSRLSPDPGRQPRIDASGAHLASAALSLTLDGRGARVTTAAGAHFRLALAGGAGAVEDAGCGIGPAPAPDGSCVRAARRALPGATAEHWEASPHGLHHWFRVERATDRVVLPIAVEGATFTAVGPDSARLRVDGDDLTYGGLAAWDAEGRPLTARMERDPVGLRLEVDTAGASFPVTVDPTLSSVWVAWNSAVCTDAGQTLGVMGDVNGDGYDDLAVGTGEYATVTSGCSGSNGRLALHFGSASGWSTTPDRVITGPLLSSVSSGDLDADGYTDLLVGRMVSARWTWDLYFGTPDGPELTPSFTTSSYETLGFVGDVNGDGYDDVGGGDVGYSVGYDDADDFLVYLGTASGLSPDHVWRYDAPLYDRATRWWDAGDINGDGFDDLVITSSSSLSYAGRVRVFLGSASGPALAPNVTLGGGAGSLGFGSTLGAGDVNADGYVDLAIADQQSTNPSVKVYLGGPAGLTGSAATTMLESVNDGRFGDSLAVGDLDGDGYDDVAITELGAHRIAIYEGSAQGSHSVADHVQARPEVTEWGVAVGHVPDADGDGDDELMAMGERATWLFEGSAAGLVDGWGAEWSFDSDRTNGGVGLATASVGDVNGDGFTDLGAGGTNRAYVFHGAEPSLVATPAFTVAGQAAFGASMAGLDADGDGYGDLVVGDPSADAGETDEGFAYLYRGGPSGLSAVSSWSAQAGQVNAHLGKVVASVGDVDGDGHGDVAVGVPDHDAGGADAGQVWIYAGAPTGLEAAPRWILTGSVAGGRFGLALATGDLDGDGRLDLVVGSPAGAGRVDAWYGAVGGFSGPPDWSATGAAGSAFGTSISAADVDGDGDDDLVVGSPSAGTGAAALYLGDAAGLAAAPSWTASGVASGDAFGASVLALADFDGDGYGDLAVGAPSETVTQADQGTVRVWSGGPAGPAAQATFLLYEYEDGASFGSSLATGDFDFDGTLDLAVGAPDAGDDFSTPEGRIFVYDGGPWDLDRDGFEATVDCDDQDASIHPGAADGCDGVDQDCDGRLDEDRDPHWLDADGDGHGDPAQVVSSCAIVPGYATVAGDCDDGNPDVYEGADEVCGGGDEDCDGLVDEPSAVDATTWYYDADADGYGGSTTWTVTCVRPFGYRAASGDCDDEDGAVNPGADERCGGVDEDCDGQADVGAVDATSWCYDADGDAYGDPAVTTSACARPARHVADCGDCDDTTRSISPADPEIDCTLVDEDCDGVVDHGTAPWYADLDGDGYGDDATLEADCGAPTGTVRVGGDCDDAMAGVHPAAAETCDLVDQDCDGLVDEGNVCAPTLSVVGSCFGPTTFTADHLEPGAQAMFVRGNPFGRFEVPNGPCAGVVVPLGAPSIAATVNADANGHFSARVRLAPPNCGGAMLVFVPATCEMSPVVYLP